MKLINTLLLLLVTVAIVGQESSIIAENAKVIQAGTGYAFTEGPAVSPDGKVFFTDQPNDRIYAWDETRGIESWSDSTGRSNGMYFNADSQLVACADLYNQLVYFDRDKKKHLLFENYEDRYLNGPNDLWIAPNGDIYFTDPYYHRDYWKEGHAPAQDVRGVYHLSHEGVASRVIDDYKQPNGIIGTPDGKILYVADINDRKIWKYGIQPDGALSGKTFFAPEGSDGMTIDDRGNIYLTMGKVWVYSPDGEMIQEIEIPESPSNVCFGGKDRDILFITARTSVYILKMNVKGVQ
ncbi:SMP-30/gluconolactonase/LRE family protein [Proteiniphilum sp.]|uniref:SMP-30/gluconolactonase/LRE family protein n=1 Tax=Proteiniphilum sp. TaxID=1926877 RepID=UPI00331C39AE